MFVAFVFSLTGCKKEQDKSQYHIAGTLYKDCGHALANRVLSLVDESAGTGSEGKKWGEVTTGTNGQFEFVYTPDGYITGLGIFLDGEYLMQNLPAFRNVPSLEVYQDNPLCSVAVKLNADSAYTQADTLVVSDLRTPSSPLKIPGPFTNGTLYTTPYPIPVPVTFLKNDSVSVAYKVNPVSLANHTGWEARTIIVKPCQAAEIEIHVQ